MLLLPVLILTTFSQLGCVVISQEIPALALPDTAVVDKILIALPTPQGGVLLLHGKQRVSRLLGDVAIDTAICSQLMCQGALRTQVRCDAGSA